MCFKINLNRFTSENENEIGAELLRNCCACQNLFLYQRTEQKHENIFFTFTVCMYLALKESTSYSKNRKNQFSALSFIFYSQF